MASWILLYKACSPECQFSGNQCAICVIQYTIVTAKPHVAFVLDINGLDQERLKPNNQGNGKARHFISISGDPLGAGWCFNHACSSGYIMKKDLNSM